MSNIPLKKSSAVRNPVPNSSSETEKDFIMKKNDFSSNQLIDGDKKDNPLDLGENLSEFIYPKSKQPLDKKEISLKKNQSSEEKKDINSIKHLLDSKYISIEVKDHHDEKIDQI